MKRLALLSILLVLAACGGSTPPLPPAPPSGPSFVIYFQPWSAALDQTALSIIANASNAASTAPRSAVTIAGYADTIGSAQANVYLSETRAQVVADAMTAAGVNPSRIRQIPLGENGIPNTSEQSERRVVIHVGP